MRIILFKKPDGEIVSTKVYVKKLIQYGSLASSLSALFWMLIGFIVLTAKPEGRTHKLFYALGVFAVFTSMSVLIQVDYKIIGSGKRTTGFISSHFLFLDYWNQFCWSYYIKLFLEFSTPI